MTLPMLAIEEGRGGRKKKKKESGELCGSINAHRPPSY